MSGSQRGLVREREVNLRNGRLLLNYLRKPFLVASVITVADSLALLLALGRVSRDTLTLILFLQGGLGLIVGVGVSLSSTPSVATVSERLFGTDPWSRDAEKHAERVGWKWLIASAFLIAIGLMASAI